MQKRVSMKHTCKVHNIENSELAEKIGDLYYDSLSELLEKLSKKLEADGVADKNRGRSKLANSLFEASQHIQKAKESIDISWQISKPHCKK
jgi:hypothetical protein